MANSFVQLPPDSSGKRLFTQQHTVEGLPVQVQAMHLADSANPEHLQKVDVRGQASVRFAEGSPTLDPFNNLRTSEGAVLGAYEYTNGPMSDLFTDTLLGAGVVTHVPQASETVLAVGSSAADSSIRSTNRYHYYQPGVGQLILMTSALGDAGKAGNVRRWGYFDENDGIFFELNGTTLNVVLRSSTSGVVVETRIPQAAWNGDRLDGTGNSGVLLDLTKAYLWGIELAWLGVGVARMIIWAPDGSRWVCHTFENPGANLGAYMASGSLPLRWENFNTALTAGTSELKSICSAVYSQGRTDYTFWRFADIARMTPVEITTNTPILSMRVKAGSRVGLYPDALNVFVSGGAVQLKLVDDATLTGATWAIAGAGSAEGDIAATAAAGGEAFGSVFVDAGAHHMHVAEHYETNDEGYHRLADDSDSYTLTLVATKLSGTTVTAVADLVYRELR